MRKLRVLRVIATVDPKSGGPIEALMQSSRLLIAMGHHVEVVSLDEPESAHVTQSDVPTHGCGPGFLKYGYTSRLGKWIEQNAERFDLAVVEGLWNHAAVGGALSLARCNVPYFVFSHGMMDPWFKVAYPAKHFLKSVFWALAQRRALNQSQAVLFTCEEELALSKGVFRGQTYATRVVPFGTSAPPESGPNDDIEFRKRVPDLPPGRQYFLYLSRIAEKKGCDLLVEAFAEVSKDFPDVDLVMAGPDSEGLAASLKQRAASLGVSHRIHWPGMLQGPSKWSAYRGAFAFTLPSHQENFGIVVAESMACGTPVLITNKVNIWREVTALDAGLVEGDDKTGVRNLLHRYLLLPSDRVQAMRENAFRGFMSSFDIGSCVRELESLFVAAVRAK